MTMADDKKQTRREAWDELRRMTDGTGMWRSVCVNAVDIDIPTVSNAPADALYMAVQRSVVGFAAAIDPNTKPTDEAARNAFAVELEQTGPRGRQLAADLGAKAPDWPWLKSRKGQLRAATIIADACWKDHVKPALLALPRRDREARRATTPYLSRDAGLLFVAVARPGNVVAPDGRHEQQLALWDPETRTRIAPIIEPHAMGPAIEGLIERMPDVLCKRLAHETIRELSFRAAEQSFIQAIDWHACHYRGRAGMWQAMNKPGQCKGDALEDVLRIGSALDVGNIIGGIGSGLWTWQEAGATNNRRLVIRVGDILAPYQEDLAATQSGRSHHKVWLPRQAPPLVGRRADYGAQFNYQWAIFCHFSQNPYELDADGTFEFLPETQRELASLAGLPSTMRSRVLDAYIEGAGAAGPIFQKAKGGRYKLSPAYQGISDNIRRSRNLGMGRRRAAKAKNQVLAKLAANIARAEKREDQTQ